MGGLNDLEQKKDWPRGKPTYFMNEIEITPTLYLHSKFAHSRDFIAV
eukprot:SAG31_NODE_25535_length_459_cov_1.244444_2_plen_46_part_01